MKTSHIIISSAITAMMLSCGGSNVKEQQSLEELTKQELATALAERDELLSLVKEVSNSLKQIKQIENYMTIASAGQSEQKWQQARILSDIKALKSHIQQRKEHLARLESRLHDSTINNKDLQETIEALRVQTDSQIEEIESLNRKLMAANEQIGALNDAVDSLNTTVSAVRDERDSARQTSVRLENELNTCFYVIATNSQLKRHNIIESGFLRKTRLMKGDYDKTFFVMSDKRTLDTLSLDTDKAKILTNHPETSYEIIESNGNKIIRIKDRDQFWSLSNYLVVQKN